ESENFNQYFNRFKNEDSDYLASTLVRLFPDESEAYLDYANIKAKTINLKDINDFYAAYLEYVQSKDLNVIKRAIDTNSKIADPSNGSVQRKLYAMNTLVKLSSELLNRQNDLQAQLLLDETLGIIKKIAAAETDPELTALPIYQDFKK
ncbi:MAG TPA: hypothetical protein PK611_09340, partial [Saprospiraceae bacterium]|nr:hypothetical protein [Saprospiraceae bacterium]